MNRTQCIKCKTQWTGDINKCPECASENSMKIKVISFEKLLGTLLPPRQYEVYMFLKEGNK